MSTRVTPLKTSGTNTHANLFADSIKELVRMAERLRVPVRNTKHDREPHLDLSPHKRTLAIRYGAKDDDHEQ